MDVSSRLRILIWVMVLGLWGVMVYQFLGEDDDAQRRMQYVANPYIGRRAPVPGGPEETLALARPPAPVTAPAPGPAAPAPTVPAPPAPGPEAQRPSSLDYIRPIELPAPAPPRRVKTRPIRREGERREADLPVPPGFYRTETRHFNVFSEGDPPSERFLEVIENLHGNLMLDLASFSPWANEEKVSIYLFHNQDTYRRITGRPAWSGGATSVPKRKVYIYESEELPGILAHELCHVYYDGFFLGGQQDPLWLSEGMATLVQVERGLAAPSWLRENLETLERGGGYTIAELIDVTTVSGASEDKVRLWYAQAYSTVRFLIRSQYRSSFYRFSQYMREGKDTTQALYRAYGMPFNRLKALEYAWRYELTSNSMNRLAPADK